MSVHVVTYENLNKSARRSYFPRRQDSVDWRRWDSPSLRRLASSCWSSLTTQERIDRHFGRSAYQYLEIRPTLDDVWDYQKYFHHQSTGGLAVLYLRSRLGIIRSSTRSEMAGTVEFFGSLSSDHDRLFLRGLYSSVFASVGEIPSDVDLSTKGNRNVDFVSGEISRKHWTARWQLVARKLASVF